MLFEKKFLDKIAHKYQLRIIILFGSRAKNTHKKDSDYDIAVYSNKILTPTKENNLFNELTKHLNNEKIDLININKSKNLELINNIFNEGKPLYEIKTEEFLKLRLNFFFDYQDFKPYLEKEFELTKKQLLSI